jgi:gliding motility-associated-like protein
VTTTGGITASITASTNVSCNGGNNGSATAAPTGGTGPYTYAWTPSGGNAATANGLTAGTYTCTVTDANGCVATATVTITQPPVLTATQAQGTILCNGGTTTASVVASGGTGPYTYAWTPSGGTGATSTAIGAGSYTCTITDSHGCTITKTFTITQPTVVSGTTTSVPVNCNGGNNGTATVTASGGTGPYTYSWAPSGGTGATTTGVIAGNYTVTITDANGCTGTATVAIAQPTAVAATTTTTPSTCGNANGTATVTPSGGVGPYTYSWAPSGGTGATANGLLTGSYTVTVTDSHGCTTTAIANVSNSGGPTATISASTNISCFGGNNGSATVTVTGGTGPFTYSWAPSGGNAATANGLTANSYTVTVTDANGCITTASVTLTQPPALTASATSTPVLCNGGNTGTATVTASGGTGPYTYLWTPSGGTGTTASGLTATTYTCTVTDANGCITTATTTVTQPTALTATQSQVNVLCNGGANGSATVVPSGGTGPYTYAWTPSGGNAATASGLAANTYTCTITDANGCVITQIITITQPSAVTATTTTTPSTCGNANGTATVTPAGGVGPYTYSWAPSGGNAATANGLVASSYTVTVTDANGCVITAIAVVSNTGGPTANISASTNISCFGGNNGSATVTVVGGTGPFIYSWAPSGGNAATANGLTFGSYTVTVTDANGCVTTASVTLTQPTALTASATSTPVLCNGGNTGTATVTASSGTAPYIYSWAPSGGTGTTASGLTATTYTCTVTDANGCITTATTTVTQPTVLTTTSSQVDELCNGGNNGSATVNPSGGTAPYVYSWTPSGGNASTASPLTSGNYTCTITDANSCIITQTFNITQPTALVLTTSFTQATCGSANGSATVTITGGTAPYGCSWSPSGGTGTTASGLIAGSYTVTITDANGCTATATVNVPNAGSPTATVNTVINVSCFGGSNGSIDIISAGGTGPYTYSWAPSGGAGSTASGLIAGSYTCTVTDANGCTATASATVTEPPALTISGTSTDVNCFGNATGTASVAVGGGTPVYSYSWAPSGGTGPNEVGLIAGNYTCTVTDNNGCIITQSFTITEPPQLTLAVAGFNVSCFNSCDGQVVVIPSGGVPNYNFSWNTGCTSPSCSNICAGSYTVDVTDANGCLATASTTVTQPTAIVITTSEVDAHCSQPDGSASANASGGTGNLTYQWIGGPANANYNNIVAATYSVIVTDANGCADTAMTTVNNLNGVNATIVSVVNLTCFNSNNGSITINATGGNGPYTYNWIPNVSITNSANGLPAGNYQVTVVDVNGCSATLTAVITQPTQVTITASAAPASVCAGTGVQLSSSGAGGTPGYNYSWNPGNLPGNTQNIIPAATTTYTAYVTDTNGCSDSTTVLVTVNPVPVAVLGANVTSGCAPLCVDFSDLSTVTAPGVITSWTWDFGDNSPVSNSQNPTHCYATAGNYTVILTVVTADGCTSTITMPSYINVFAIPVAAFGASPQPTTILNPIVTFTDSSTNASSWNWSFGDLLNSTSTLQNPSFNFPDPTCYQVVLTVTSVDGCVDTATHQVCIDPDATLFVPNAFTPNGDGVNDVFLPVGVGIDPDHFEMWIFDRWGNMIFYTDNFAKGWDGKVQGHEDICQIDTYVWKIKALDITGTKHNIIGKVSIIK